MPKLQGDDECLHWNRRDLLVLAHVVDSYVPGRTAAVQAGGNLGMFAAALADQFEAVYTFEPDALLFPMMVANAPAENIIRFQAALGSDRNLIGTRRTTDTQTHSGVTHVHGRGIIPTMRLDDLALPVVDLLYLDIEGFELFALDGACETIERCRPVVVTEINDCCERYGYTEADVIGLMTTHGYRLAETMHHDRIFIPSERA